MSKTPEAPHMLMTKSFIVTDETHRKDGILFEDPSNGWKYYIRVYEKPGQLAADLEKITAWLVERFK